jgi:hypothetical protein
MKQSGMKTADEVIVADPTDGMRRLREGLRHILSVPKPSNGHRPRRKHRRAKK